MITETSTNITFTFDLEDHRPDGSYKKTYPENTIKILDFLDQYSAKGTFFVVGNIIDDEPELIKRISSQGHEIAFHSHSHTILDKESLKDFNRYTHQYKETLQDLTGKAIVGYRAPVFSLKQNTLWVLNSLQELGFIYSSSIIPGKSVLHGISNTPKHPFYWSNGILEIPVPVFSFSRFSIPYLGGFYLRYLPIKFIIHLARKNSKQFQWSYCHPYDFASEEPYFCIKNTNHLISILLWFNRRHTIAKFQALLGNKNIEISKTTFSQQIEHGDFNAAEQTLIP